MKKHFYTIGSIIVLLFSALIFIVLPAMVGGSKAQKLPPFGSYDGKPILYEQGTDFSNAVANYADLYKMQGLELNDNAYFYLFSNAFNSTVLKMAYDTAVEKSGWKVSAAAVNRGILPYFSDENGNYSSRLYKQTSDEQKRELASSIKKTLVSQRFHEDNFGSYETLGKESLFGLKASSKEIPFLREMGEKTRTFNAATFSTENYPEEKITAYGKEHSEYFTKYNLSVITVSDESTAKTVLDRLNKNEIVFADAVTEYSTKNYSNEAGKINNTYNYQIKNLIADDASFKSVCELKSGETSGIVKTNSGYSIFKADGNAVQPDFTDAATKVDVKSYINTYERGIIEDYFVAIAKDFAAGALQGGFDSACEKFNTTKQEIADVSLNYGNLSILGTLPVEANSPFAGASNDENFIKTAFALKQNEISEPLILGRTVVVLQMKEEKTGGTDAQTAAETFPAEIKNFDQSAAQAALFDSPKVVNNVMTVYFNNFMSKN